VKFFILDNLLPISIAEDIHKDFPDVVNMRLMNSIREKKYTSKNLDKFSSKMADITFAFQDTKVVSIIEKITGIENQFPDSKLYAGGLSAMGRGHFLGPHLDNSHDGERKNYRTLNLLYYITPEWELSCGGNLELWDARVKKSTTIISSFNRLVVMETNAKSWHSVSKVQVDKLRYCVSNYYFSPNSPTGENYFNVTKFEGKPEQIFLRIIFWTDNKFRQTVRLIFPNGIGKKDIYQGTEK
jgi:Rps23 Pro-64 3,4-dihydroxylase Tpa1-like proline 4-hydroxylase